MSKVCIHNAILVVDGEQLLNGGAIVFSDNKIIGIYDRWENQVPVDQLIDANGNYVIPGMIDVHIHGAMGQDFIRPSQNCVDVVAKNLVKDGCTSFFASLTVESHEETCQILDVLGQVKQPENGANYLGIHAEGPYLSAQYKALMKEEYLRDPNLKEFDEMQQAAHGKLKYMTFAPEREGSEELVRKATAQGVHCMIGHTNARVSDVQRAYEAGSVGFTHLYNAMSQHTHRNPGTVTGAFLQKNMMAELISDGFHVDPAVVKVTYDSFGPKRIALITDAMLGKDMPDGEYVFSGLHCIKKGKTVQVKETGRISGSCIGMNDAIVRMQQYTGCSINDLVQMACVNPSYLAQVSDKKGTLESGKDADIVMLSKELEVLMTIVSGNILFDNGDQK
ncbi:MAG: N-acetylglucosamine-6-phosphate deacetylase [Erysipelotrichaceae bacterium]|nr:N-acetylglucosamine-6-phosphate deacetylase [Erysipelotrichaceae bacterium]